MTEAVAEKAPKAKAKEEKKEPAVLTLAEINTIHRKKQEVTYRIEARFQELIETAKRELRELIDAGTDITQYELELVQPGDEKPAKKSKK